MANVYIQNLEDIQDVSHLSSDDELLITQHLNNQYLTKNVSLEKIQKYISNITESLLDTKFDGKYTQFGHEHNISNIIDFKEQNYTMSQIADLSNQVHYIQDIVDFNTHRHLLSDITDLSNQTHTMSQITDLSNQVHKISDISDFYTHTHELSQINGFENGTISQVSSLIYTKYYECTSQDNINIELSNNTVTKITVNSSSLRLVFENNNVLKNSLIVVENNSGHSVPLAFGGYSFVSDQEDALKLIPNNLSCLFEFREIQPNKFFVHKYIINGVESTDLEKIYVTSPYIYDIYGNQITEYPLKSTEYPKGSAHTWTFLNPPYSNNDYVFYAWYTNGNFYKVGDELKFNDSIEISALYNTIKRISFIDIDNSILSYYDVLSSLDDVTIKGWDNKEYDAINYPEIPGHYIYSWDKSIPKLTTLSGNVNIKIIKKDEIKVDPTDQEIDKFFKDGKEVNSDDVILFSLSSVYDEDKSLLSANLLVVNENITTDDNNTYISII